MKYFYKLLNYEFSSLFRPAAMVYLGVIIGPLIFMRIALRENGGVPFTRVEGLYANSGAIVVVVVLFAVLSSIFIQNIYADYWGSKGIYTLLTLPVKREYIYFSKLISFFIAAVGFAVAQIIGYMVAYGLFAPSIVYYDSATGIPLYREMHNGLFLSFIRSDFMRLFIPAGSKSMVSSSSIFVASVCAIYYGALCERSKKYWGYVFIVLAVILMIYVINYRLHVLDHFFPVEYVNIYSYSAMLFLLSAFFVWHSIRLVKSSAIG